MCGLRRKDGRNVFSIHPDFQARAYSASIGAFLYIPTLRDISGFLITNRRDFPLAFRSFMRRRLYFPSEAGPPPADKPFSHFWTTKLVGLLKMPHGFFCTMLLTSDYSHTILTMIPGAEIGIEEGVSAIAGLLTG